MEHLEEKIAHLTKTVDDLSDMVARQDADLRRLQAVVTKLAAREAEREAEGSGGVVLGNERPPHY